MCIRDRSTITDCMHLWLGFRLYGRCDWSEVHCSYSVLVYVAMKIEVELSLKLKLRGISDVNLVFIPMTFASNFGIIFLQMSQKSFSLDAGFHSKNASNSISGCASAQTAHGSSQHSYCTDPTWIYGPLHMVKGKRLDGTAMSAKRMSRLTKWHCLNIGRATTQTDLNFRK